MSNQTDRRRERSRGTTIVGWSLILVGILGNSDLLAALVWNNFVYGRYSDSQIVYDAPIAIRIVLLVELLAGVGILRLMKSAYIVVTLLGTLMLIGAAIGVVDYARTQQWLGFWVIGFVGTLVILMLYVLLRRKGRKEFFHR